ncbi:hypothetical protein CSKR_202332 [Clonorchis sinensis]|uniref:Uncharacterized protein n=1 Tax=Clonorchis sinensis TaxID=79923 RepID=A0A8T1MTZ5_CLOSI|nr:hypothetical protein CSKR_202332 [Clonorchis sinensis]
MWPRHFSAASDLAEPQSLRYSLAERLERTPRQLLRAPNRPSHSACQGDKSSAPVPSAPTDAT